PRGCFPALPAAARRILLVGLPPRGVPAQLGAAHRSRPALARTCKPLPRLHGRQVAAPAGAAFGPRAGNRRARKLVDELVRGKRQELDVAVVGGDALEELRCLVVAP